MLKLRPKPQLHRAAQAVGAESFRPVDDAAGPSGQNDRRNVLWWILLAVLIVL
jgi:hypothetical protein